MRNRYGLIGFPLGHSFSKSYFTQKFTSQSIDAVYDLFPLEDLSEFIPLLKEYPDLCGLNVTIPFKQKIIPFLNELHEASAMINAVNTIQIIKKNDGLILTGWNTDAPAFESELFDFTGNESGKALILGTGGAASAVAYVLTKSGWDFSFVSRHPINDSVLSYQMLDEAIINSTKLIVNATPLGMFPKIEQSPDIPYFALNNNHFLFDLVYNPDETLFLKKGKEQGTKIRNGLGMLYKQAELAWNIWQTGNNMR